MMTQREMIEAYEEEREVAMIEYALNRARKICLNHDCKDCPIHSVCEVFFKDAPDFMNFSGEVSE